jgi:hypothetical protein
VSGPLDTLHATLARQLEGSPVPVYRWLPASADDTPCLVVGRPSLEPDADTPAVATIEVGVFALGRRTLGDDEQAELLALGDLLFARYWRPPAVEGMTLRLDGLEAGTVEVAGQTLPAYTATLSARFLPCP